MSFIYKDNQLVNKLLNHALKYEAKFTKQGQQAEQIRSIFLQHIKDLQDQIGPSNAQKDPNAGPNISHENDAALGSPQLESLGDLIKWLASSKTAIDGKRVAFDTNPNDDDYIPYQLETHTTTLQQRGQDLGRFYVNQELLEKYLVSLQAYENQHPNQAMQVQLRARIQDANQELGLNVSNRYQPPEKTLPDNTVLDNVPQAINPKYPNQTGPISLTFGDLKDGASFNAWLTKNNIALDTGHGHLMAINHPQFDFKKIVDAIIQRAQYWAARVTDAASKERTNFYIRQSDRLDSQFTGSTSKQPDVVQPINQDQATQSGSAAQNLTNLTNEIIDTLPLALQNIDFNRIKTFFGKIAQLMNNNPTVMNYIANTNNLMEQASALTDNNDTFFQLGISPSALAHMFKDKQTPGQHFYPMVQLLNQIVDNVRAVIGYFMSQYVSKLNPNQRAFVFGQIGKRPDDSSIYSRNIEYINQWARTPHN